MPRFTHLFSYLYDAPPLAGSREIYTGEHLKIGKLANNYQEDNSPSPNPLVLFPHIGKIESLPHKYGADKESAMLTISALNSYLQSFNAPSIHDEFDHLIRVFRGDAVKEVIAPIAAAPELQLPDLQVDLQAGTVMFNGTKYCDLKPDFILGLHHCVEAKGEWVSWEKHGIVAPGRVKRGAPKELLDLIEHRSKRGHRLKRKK